MTALKCFRQSGMLSSETVFICYIMFLSEEINSKQVLVISCYNNAMAKIHYYDII